MAAVVDSIISFTLRKIDVLAIQQIGYSFGVRDKLKSIEKDLEWMRRFLQDADRKLGQADKRLEKLVADMFAVIRKIEDAVDTFRLREERQRRRGTFEKCLSAGSDFASLIGIGKAIEEIKKEISDVYARKETYGVPDFDGREGPSYVSEKLQVYRRAAALAVGDEVVGFAKHVEELVEGLIGGGGGGGGEGARDNLRRRVVSIVATGGAGKTTLANKVYNSDKVRNHFHNSGIAAWVCVSQTYNAKYLLREVAEKVTCLSKQNSEFLSEKDLQERLSEFLQKKRYLIVLDDVWDTDAWVQLKAAFPDVKNGSRIILTTRKVEVARHADPHPANLLFDLRSLNAEDSWKLFLKKAFPWEETSTEIPCSSSSSKAELTDVGKEIVKKCGGLPLAISVVGSILAAKGGAKVQDWKNVLDSLTARLSGESVHCEDIIALSYYDLPYHLKPCFLYLGLFPEDTPIFAGELKRLWIAEGFIQPEEGRETEDLADDYLAELIDRSLVRVATTDEEDRSVRSCGIHDLLHAFAISEGTKYNFLAVDSKNISTPTTFSTIEARWLAVHDLEDVLRENNILNLRSLLCFDGKVVSLSDLCKGLKLLRVLKLKLDSSSSSIIKDFPSEELTHLRYLDLGDYDAMRVLLSPSIGNLYNLETLILPRRVCLPKELWKLHRLKHLEAEYCEFEGEPRVCNLNNLRTLKLGMGSWIEEATVVSSLGGLRNLSIRAVTFNAFKPLWMEGLGNLISKLVNLRSIEVDLFNSMSKNIITLTLEHHTHLSALILRGVQLGRLSKLPPKLTTVYLSGSELRDDPVPTLEMLTDLVSLTLGFDAYTEEKMISSANGFPQLKRLVIDSMDQLEELVVEQGAMPKLEILEIHTCENFKLVEGLQCIRTLKEVVLRPPSVELKNWLEKAKEKDWYKKLDVRIYELYYKL